MKIEEPEVIEYVPKREAEGKRWGKRLKAKKQNDKSVVNWGIILGLGVVWVLVLLGAIFLKARMFMMLLPAIIVMLLIYVAVCTFIFLGKVNKE